MSKIDRKKSTPADSAPAQAKGQSRLFFSDSDRIRQLTWVLLLICSVSLLVSSVYRAVTFPFTHDESLSYFIFSGDPIWGGSANNHVLNTHLMRLCSILFGSSELSLRLPNLLAHLIYLASSLWLLKRFQHPVILIPGFVMLNLNPFLLDFFFVARGYGLALGFMMLSMVLLGRAFDEKPQKHFLSYLYSSVLAGSLAVLANYSFLNYYAPLLLVSAWLLMTDTSLRRFSRSHIRPALILFSATAVFLSFILVKVLGLQQGGEFYAGGSSNNFIADTIGSLVKGSLYSAFASETTVSAVSILVIVLFVSMLFLGLYRFFLRKESSLFILFLLLLTAAAVLPLLQHTLFKTLFPVERGALYYLPLAAVVLLFALDWLIRIPTGRLQTGMMVLLPAALAMILGWNFYRNFDPQRCYTWSYDHHTKEVLGIIDQDRRTYFPGKPIFLSNSWRLEPSLNFYRITRNYGWLSPISRNPVGSICCNYIYAFESEVDEQILTGQPVLLASYPDTQTVLIRFNYLHCPEKPL